MNRELDVRPFGAAAKIVAVALLVLVAVTLALVALLAAGAVRLRHHMSA